VDGEEPFQQIGVFLAGPKINGRCAVARGCNRRTPSHIFKSPPMEQVTEGGFHRLGGLELGRANPTLFHA